MSEFDLNRRVEKIREQQAMEARWAQQEVARQKSLTQEKGVVFSLARAFIVWARAHNIASTDEYERAYESYEVNVWRGLKRHKESRQREVGSKLVRRAWTIWTGSPRNWSYEQGRGEKSGTTSPEKRIIEAAETRAITLSVTQVDRYGPQTIEFDQAGHFSGTASGSWISSYASSDNWKELVSADDILDGVARIAVSRGLDANTFSEYWSQ